MPKRFDVLVVGAGAAGLAAAIDTGAAGLKTLVIDVNSTYGGAAALSGGSCCLVGTRTQRDAGVDDSVDLAFADWMQWGGEAADEQWARTYLAQSARDLFDWTEALGVEWKASGLRQAEGNSVPREHHPTGGGAALAAILYGAASTPTTEWSFGTTAEALLVQDHCVIGARLLRDQGFDEVFARAVLISTGGFTNDEEMVAKHMTRIPAGRYLHGGGPNACGDGHRLLQEVGATFVNMEHMWVYPIGTPNPRDQGHQRGLAVRGLVDEVWLNAQGRRFHNEDMRGGFSGTNALLSQPNQTCWSIFDAGELPKLRLLCDPYFDGIGSSTGEFLQSSEFVWQAETLADLTTRLPLPSKTAEREITRFNEDVVNGVDPEFGRRLGRTRRLDQAPYYSIQYMPLVQKNLGGVKTDLSCRVIGAGGRPIAGLYAAGEVAGMAGGHINGERGLEGTMLGPSILAGRIAGRAIARSIRSGNRNGAV